jgi:hypothetical protein
VGFGIRDLLFLIHHIEKGEKKERRLARRKRKDTAGCSWGTQCPWPATTAACRCSIRPFHISTPRTASGRMLRTEKMTGIDARVAVAVAVGVLTAQPRVRRTDGAASGGGELGRCPVFGVGSDFRQPGPSVRMLYGPIMYGQQGTPRLVASAGYLVGRDKDACGRDGRPDGATAMDGAVVARVQGEPVLFAARVVPAGRRSVIPCPSGGIARLTWPVRVPAPLELTCIHVCSKGRTGSGLVNARGSWACCRNKLLSVCAPAQVVPPGCFRSVVLTGVRCYLCRWCIFSSTNKNPIIYVWQNQP